MKIKQLKKSPYKLAIDRMEREVNRATAHVEKLAKLYSLHKKGTK